MTVMSLPLTTMDSVSTLQVARPEFDVNIFFPMPLLRLGASGRPNHFHEIMSQGQLHCETTSVPGKKSILFVSDVINENLLVFASSAWKR
jgi:hypothetical protein